MNNSLSLVFTGDIGFDRYMDGKWDDPGLLSGEILDFCCSADHVIANVEGPIIDTSRNTETNGTAQLMHTMDPSATRVLERIGADIWNICNNHIMDAGDRGVFETISVARACNAVTLGAGMNIDEALAPVYFKEAGGVGIFSVGYRRGCKPAGERKAGCINWNEDELIRKNIEEIRSKCKWCIMIVHGGEEFTSLPAPYTRDRLRSFLEMGADAVVCHHPHVPMNYEKVGSKYIFYSLGNFIFDTDYQRAQFNTERGILLKLLVSEETLTFEAMGILLDRGTEHISCAELPDIFTDVPEDQYALLAPLAAKMFIAATKRQLIYLKPEIYSNATEEMWAENFNDPMRSGRVPGEALDLAVILPLAQKERDGKWKNSTLEKVKEYILSQM